MPIQRAIVTAHPCIDVERQRLLDDIQVLTSLLTRAEVHERRVDAAEERDAHIEQQVTRVEEAAVKIERRLIELDATDATAAEEALFDQERTQLRARLAALQQKASALRNAALENEVFDAVAFAARPPGVRGRLRATLHALVVDMRSDPTVPSASVRPFQVRLAELVRERRTALAAAAERVEDARDYITSVVSIVAGLRPMVVDVGETSELGTLPFSTERTLAATRIEMARSAVREARTELDELAHDWSELDELAARPDWKRLPFGQLSELLSPADESTAARHGTIGQRIAEADEMSRALALWLEELRRAVADAPPPA